jgi:hypothetical protein
MTCFDMAPDIRPEPDDEIEELEAFDLDDSDFLPLATGDFSTDL